MVNEFGKFGQTLYNLARGIDPRPGSSSARGPTPRGAGERLIDELHWSRSL